MKGLLRIEIGNVCVLRGCFCAGVEFLLLLHFAPHFVGQGAQIQIERNIHPNK